MAEKQKNELNEAQIIAFLSDIVTKIQTEEDPIELNQFRRLFRKVVPFHLRSYFAAYLLKQIYVGRAPRIQVSSGRGDRNGRDDRNARNDQGGRSDKGGRGDQNGRGERSERGDRGDRRGRGDQNGRGESSRAEHGDRQKRGEGRKRDGEGRSAGESRPAGEGRPAAEPRNVLPDDVSTTLFVSIGRNRRVYPRDLIGLIMQNVEIEREHVGDIRVLDNYSFVQVITEDAQKIIDALNEFEFRGRKLAVSFSRKKEEAAGGTDAVGGSESAGGFGAVGGSVADAGFDADGEADAPRESDFSDSLDGDGSYDDESATLDEGSADAEPDDDVKNNSDV